MALTDSERLRAYLGETIPEGKSASDTLFSDDQIEDLLARHGSPEKARSEGWEWKNAALTTLVTTVEGSSTRKLSDASKAARASAAQFAPGGGGRTRVHQIMRDY